jgi:hypothetical protein
MIDDYILVFFFYIFTAIEATNAPRSRKNFARYINCEVTEIATKLMQRHFAFVN